MVPESMLSIVEVKKVPVLGLVSATAVALGWISAVVKVGSVVETFCSTIVGLGAASVVAEVKTVAADGEGGSVVEFFSSNIVALGSVSVVGEVKIRSKVGIGRSLGVIKGISLSLVSPLRLFERALAITHPATQTSNTTQTIAISVIATIVNFVLALLVDIVEVVAEFIEEVMVFVVVLVTAAGVVEIHAVNDIDPGDAANISTLSAFDFTHATPDSSCLNADASRNIEPI